MASGQHDTQRQATAMRAWQFSLRRLMLWILACALFMAMIKWWGMAGFVLLVVFAVPYALFHRTAPGFDCA